MFDFLLFKLERISFFSLEAQKCIDFVASSDIILVCLENS